MLFNLILRNLEMPEDEDEILITAGFDACRLLRSRMIEAGANLFNDDGKKIFDLVIEKVSNNE